MHSFKVLVITMLVMVLLVPMALAEEASASKLNVQLNPQLDYLVLVNNDNPYEFGGEYDTTLTEKNENGEYVAMSYVPDTGGEPTLVEKATFMAFTQLQANLAQRGMLVQLLSGYRTKDDQDWLVNYYKENPVSWSVAEAGKSEHHTGLVLSVQIWYHGDDGKYLWFTETEERQEAIPFFALLHEVMPDYGFIDRFPAGKEDWTGYGSEPFEIRFVGSAEVAHEIMDNGLCLEEYLNK